MNRHKAPKKSKQGRTTSKAHRQGPKGPSSGSFHSSTRSTTAPATAGFVIRSPTQIKFGAAPYNTGAGCDGLRVHFSCPYSQVIGQTSSNAVMTGISNTSVTPVFGQFVTPTIAQGTNIPGLTSPLVNIPEAFARFRFRRLVFRYVTSLNTGYSGQLGMTYQQDGAAPSPVTVSAILEQPRSVAFPVWSIAPVELIACEDKNMNDQDAESYFSFSNNVSTEANARLTCQGTITMASDTVYTGPLKLGTLYVEGILDLYLLAAVAQIGSFGGRIQRAFPLLARSSDVDEDSVQCPPIPVTMVQSSRPAEVKIERKDDFKVVLIAPTQAESKDGVTSVASSSGQLINVPTKTEDDWVRLRAIRSSLGLHP
jgi:hypothetical protein